MPPDTDDKTDAGAKTGAPSDAVELLVVDAGDQIVQRPGAH